MSEKETILTWRPGNGKGAYLYRTHYTAVREFILRILDEEKRITLIDLIERAGDQLTLDPPDADRSWMLLQVKSDLEARGLITVSWIGPQRVQLIEKNERHGMPLTI